MKISVTITTLLVLLLATASAFAQTGVSSVRSLACTINPGYTMADVVETARSFEWSEETSPGFVAGKVEGYCIWAFKNDWNVYSLFLSILRCFRSIFLNFPGKIFIFQR